MGYKNIFTLCSIFWLSSSLYCQNQPIDVTDQTIKFSGLGGERTLYFGFEKGDQIIFNFKEVDGKELKVIEIAEYPSNVKFTEYKTSRVENKTFTVNQRGVWSFHFENSSLSGKICQIKIQRIAENDASRNFNSDVVWKNVNDTNYSEENERYLIKSDTSVSNTEQTVTVHSTGSLQFPNRNMAQFTIPENTIAWSYYIGVNEEKSHAFSKATASFTKNAAKVLLDIPGSGPMAALALYGASYFIQLNSGDAVDYYLVDANTANVFNSTGRVQSAYKYQMQAQNGFSRMTSPLNGLLYACLVNHNYVTSETVLIKMSFITVKQEWGTHQIKKMSIITKNLPFTAN